MAIEYRKSNNSRCSQQKDEDTFSTPPHHLQFSCDDLFLESGCKNRQKMNVIVELPREARVIDKLKTLRRFFAKLFNSAGDYCLNIRVWLATFELVRLETNNCQSARCVSNAMEKISPRVLRGMTRRSWWVT